MIISHVKIIAFQTIFNLSFWIFYIARKDCRLCSNVDHDISFSFAALTRDEISCSTLEINSAPMHYSLFKRFRSGFISFLRLFLLSVAGFSQNLSISFLAFKTSIFNVSPNIRFSS